jgi:hypothetical protein
MAIVSRRIAVVSTFLLLSGCDRAPAAKQAVSPVLVRGVGVSITAADLRDRLSLEPVTSRTELRDPERKAAFLNQVIDEELLASEARRLGLDQTPEFKATVRALLLHRLAEQRAHSRTGGAAPDARQQAAERQASLEAMRKQAQVETVSSAVEAFDPAAP